MADSNDKELSAMEKPFLCNMADSNDKELSAMEKKVVRQVEYYFGDINLPRDKFLQEKMQEDDGWVSMETMLNFNRLKSLCDDPTKICEALQKSSSGLMEVSEDKLKIRRCPTQALPDNTKERRDEMASRSVYVKGFPEDSTLDDLQEFFEQHGKIDTIFMRRTKGDKNFKGSVLVTFNEKDEENTFLKKEDVKYKENDLIKMTKEQYIKKKTDEDKHKKRGHADSDKKKEDEMRKEQSDKNVEDHMTKGAVLFMKGLPAEVSLEDIRSYFSDFGEVAWVEFASGDEKALVRFKEAEAASALEKAKAANDGKVIMNNSELETRVLEGEEEKEYWRKMYREIADRRIQGRSRNFQNRKRKFGGKPYKGNKHDDNDDSPAKKQKTEAVAEKTKTEAAAE